MIIDLSRKAWFVYPRRAFSLFSTSKIFKVRVLKLLKDRIVGWNQMIKHTDSPRRSLQLCQNPHSYFRPLFNWSGRLWYDVGLHPLKALKFLNLFAFLLCTKIQPVENSRSSCQRHRSRQSSTWSFFRDLIDILPSSHLIVPFWYAGEPIYPWR